MTNLKNQNKDWLSGYLEGLAEATSLHNKSSDYEEFYRQVRKAYEETSALIGQAPSAELREQWSGEAAAYLEVAGAANEAMAVPYNWELTPQLTPFIAWRQSLAKSWAAKA